MKPLNPNKAQILLMFTRTPMVKVVNRELEYYTSDDERLIGFISLDRVDGSFHSMLFDRNSLGRYQIVDLSTDHSTIEIARTDLERMMASYVPDNTVLTKKGSSTDFFTLVANTAQIHPNFMRLKDEGFFTPARKVIEEVGFHHVDVDGNFTEQLQSINGFDARIWELYLWCYFREEDFDFDTTHDAPDFMINKFGEEVAVEAVHIKRTQKLDEGIASLDIREVFEKLRNEMPLMFGSPLYSKLKHEYQSQRYWELPHVKGKPLVFAIADFHADMSMTWSFPGIISILYGIEQSIGHNEDGTATLVASFGNKYEKGSRVKVSPLFLDDQFENVSAVLFSPCGTLSKFNRLGVQAGYGDSRYTLFQVKMCYNNLKNAIFPNLFFNVVDENCHETWADGIQIFHNPFAKIPLNPNLFPHAGHHFYRDGLLYSDMPNNHTISTTTWNIKNLPVELKNFSIQTKEAFNNVIRQFDL